MKLNILIIIFTFLIKIYKLEFQNLVYLKDCLYKNWFLEEFLIKNFSFCKNKACYFIMSTKNSWGQSKKKFQEYKFHNSLKY